ncbi:hypothetical protein FRACYDRAFT_236006 [Fragilariopsis cylindrus CCMP1102]|uniref:Uncharacterized protein n=1 Tax=Fragilariopsis cylindrus CCMP1102 TaxID=635003 RepID=A0A1E7FPC5_9STRA|nr:hypothetical protein FRACYDRAFT_236006 [Fragilariopsis cylindrus CCMP1102]|eukprot:OEU19945.1 hypothetical protein FRACYDRAFT_236006 [Fragilariopsis cylindrus CCMP1102]
MISVKSNDPGENRQQRRGVVVVRIHILFVETIIFILTTHSIIGIVLSSTMGAVVATSNSNPIRNASPLPIQLKGSAFETDWDDIGNDDDDDGDDRSSSSRPRRYRRPSVFGFGREFSLYESPRGGAGARNSNNNNNDYINNNDSGYSFSRGGRPPLNSPTLSQSLSQQRQRRKQKQQQQNQNIPRVFQTAQNWWMKEIDPKIQRLPKIICRIEPSTTLKIRKTFRPLKTIIRLGADYNTQQGVWQFKSSWEDAIIGSKLTLTGNRELQLTKSWQLSVGAVEDLVTRLRFRAAINLQTFQGTVRVGFRTERLTPIDVVEGFSILKRLPLDGSGGNLKLEVKANVALPEPEIEYSTEAQRSLIGMGDIEVSIDEMNLLLDY